MKKKITDNIAQEKKTKKKKERKRKEKKPPSTNFLPAALGSPPALPHQDNISPWSCPWLSVRLSELSEAEFEFFFHPLLSAQGGLAAKLN